MEPRRTAAQEEAIRSDLPEICVTAGAGSGKTRVLVERFVRLVLETGIGVDRILAITFTEKAAAELKERIARAFEAVKREKERREVEFAYISTIDSFCARLLREHALEAGVDPRFRVLEELEAARLMQESADAVLLGRPEDALLRLVESTGIGDLAATVRSLYEKVRHAGLPLAPGTLEPQPAGATAPVLLDEVLRELAQAPAREALSPRQAETVRNLMDLADGIRAIPPSDSPGRIASRYREWRARFDFRGVAGRPRLAAALHRLEEALEACCAEELERRASPFRSELAAILASFDEEYRRRKRAAAALDFADLEWLARELLSGSGETRRRLESRFRHVFLDEFQDTNPLQKEIVDLLRGGGSLFVVGDAKQSIYGFRDADVGIIEELRARADRAGGDLRLPENFRSRPELVDFANRLFASPLWLAGGVPFEPMRPGAAHHPKPVPSVEILHVEGDNAEEARRREAGALAARLADLLEGGRLAISRRDGESEGRALSYGDAAILFRTTTSMRLYERALAELRIPYFVQNGRGYFQTQEVRDLVNLMRVVDNPRDDFALAAVLRSPLCGLTDDDLLRITLGRSSGQRLWDRLDGQSDLPSGARENLARFRALLDRVRQRKGQGPLWRGLEAVLSETPLALDALLHFNGRRRFANLAKLVQLVRSWESGEDPSLPALADLLEEFQGEETRESEAMVESSQDDTVKLMTIHAAKGLEFPLVAVADLGRSEPGFRTREIFRRGEGVGLYFYDPASGSRSLKPSSTLRLEERQKAAERREENRLLYVAVTRAREHLILSGWSAASAKNDDTWMKSILQALGGEVAVAADPSLRTTRGEKPPQSAAAFVSLAGEQRDRLLAGEALTGGPATAAIFSLAGEIMRRVALPSPPPDATPYLTTATEIVQHRLCPRRYHLRYRIGAPSVRFPRAPARRVEAEAGTADEMAGLDEAEVVAEIAVSDEGLTGGAVVKDDELPAEVLGDRVHRMLAEEASSPLIGELLATLSPADQKEATRQVETFQKSELGRRVAQGEAMKEVPFAMGRCGATLRGQIDLILRGSGGELMVVDYKTSRVAAKEVAEKAADYELQLRLYALAVRAVFGRLPRRACLHFLHPDVIHDVSLTPGDLDDAERAIEAFFSSHRGGTYPQVPARHCFACGYQRPYCPDVLGRIPAPAR